MDDFLLKISLLMALETDLIALRFQKVACLRGVGVMTRNAFSFFQPCMDIRFVQPYLLLAVTGKADFIAIFLQQQFRNQAVAQMAIFAFFLFDYSMHIFHHQIFISKFFVAIEAIFLNKSLPCRLTPPQRFLLGCFRTRKQKNSA
jgi:hypothetical protein